MSTEAFDRQFDAFVEAEHGAVLHQLDDWHRTQTSVGQKIAEQDWQGIVELAKSQIAMMPRYTEPDSPYIALARAYEELGQRDDAVRTLQEFARRGGYDPAALKRLSAWLDEDGHTADAADVLRTVNLVDPLDPEVHGMLGDLLLKSGQPEQALTEFEVALAQDPHDKATAYFRLATAHQGLGDLDASRARLLDALDIAPNYRPAQRLLLELARGDSNKQN